jgi:hypothetical protein
MATFATFAGGEAGDDVVITGLGRLRLGPDRPSTVKAFRDTRLILNRKMAHISRSVIPGLTRYPAVLAIAADYAEYCQI